MDERNSHNEKAESHPIQEQEFDKLDKAIREWGRKLWLDIKNNSHSTKFWMELFALIVLGLYTAFAALQWCANEKAAEAARDSVDLLRSSTHLDQRAWLGVTEVATPTELNEGTLLNPSAFLVNSGRTPAFNVVQRAGYRIVKTGDIFDPAHEVSVSNIFRQGVVQPGGKRILSIHDIGKISRQRADELNSGQYRLYLFGEITYDDAFHLPHVTRFSMRMELGKPLSFAPYGSYDYAD
jgi:hypothetical protein